MVADINGHNVATLGNYIYFGAKVDESDTARQSALWKTDGTAHGTVLVSDVVNGIGCNGARGRQEALL